MLRYRLPPGYRRAQPVRRPKLDAFTGIIDQILREDQYRPKKQRHTAKRIGERLRAEYGFTGGDTIVKAYVREQRLGGQEMFVPLAHPPGDAQADFGEALVVIAGVECKAHYLVVDHSGLRCARREFDQVASLRVEGVSISATARVTGHSRHTLARWLERASLAAKRFNQRMLRDVAIIELQADARCTFIGTKSSATGLCAAIEVCSRLWAGSVLGRRASRNATAVLNDVILRGRVVGFPLIATEGFESYVGVIERLLGSACVSGHVLKTRRNDRGGRVERRQRIGPAGRLQAALWESADSETLHTAFVERLTRTIRPGSAYVRRRSPGHARGADQRHGHVDLLRGSYHVIRPHRALQCGRETRPPAMHAGWVNAPMNWSDIFTAPAALYAFHVAVVRVPGAGQLMHTSPAALSSFSWPHEHRSAA